MEDSKLSDIDSTVALASSASLIGVNDLGGGSFSDQRWSIAQVATYILSGLKKLITVGSDGTTLTDVFFSTSVSELITNNQSYLLGVDYSQNTSTNTITGLTISFTSGQKILARI